MSGRLLVLGLDGATWKLLRPLIKNGELPFLGKLMKSGYCANLRGTVPPLTPSVWTSFLTGVNPGKHKIMGFMNYWSNPPRLYTTRDVSRITVDKYLKKFGFKTYMSFRGLADLISQAGTDIKEVGVDKLILGVERKINKFLGEDRKKKFDFSFLLIKEVDIAQHLFWGRPELIEFFRRLDGILSGLRGFHLLIISDHGFHPAAKVQFAVWAWIGKEYRDTSRQFSIARLLWSIFHGLNLLIKKTGYNPAVGMGKGLKKMVLERAENKDFRVTLEGIYIYRQNFDKHDLIKKLRTLKYKGKRVFAMVAPRERIYKGPFTRYAPDIVWVPNKNFCINISPVEKQVFFPHLSNIRGNHTGDLEGVFILSPFNSKERRGLKKTISILDIFPLICETLQVPVPVNIEGISPLKDYSSLDKKVEGARKVILSALKKYSGCLGMAFTGRKDSSVMLDITRRVCIENSLSLPEVLFIDTGKHFPESVEHFEKVVQRYRLRVRRMHGSNKVEMIEKAISESGWKALMTAIRRDEHKARKGEKSFSLRQSHMRVHPMLEFTESDIWDYLKRFGVSYNPLYDMGYRSLEERGLTKKVIDPSRDERSGRERNKEIIMQKLRNLGYF